MKVFYVIIGLAISSNARKNLMHSLNLDSFENQNIFNKIMK